MIDIGQLLGNLKIAALNDMQQAAWDACKKPNDLLLLSPTGSGKTLGFLIPFLEHIDAHKQGIQGLIIVPSRELGLQIEQVFKQMKTGLKVNCCYGGHSTKIEKQNLEQAPSLLIGTPGRLAFHIRNKYVNTNSISIVILDEFDKALEFGFKEEMSFILSSLKNVQKRILTSATNMNDLPDFTGVKNVTRLNFLNKKNSPSALKLKVVHAAGKDKLDALIGLICKVGNTSSLVFCNHRDAVQRISDLLLSSNLSHGIFHGGMEQEDREKTLIRLRNGSIRLLITTDLASRGLDIPEIENVIHYQLPVTEDVFIHRNGRTARMHACGTSYLLLGQNEHIPPFIKEKMETEQIEAKNKIPDNAPWCTLYIGAGKKDKINKMDIVGMLLQKGKLQKDELGLIEVLDHASYVAVKRDKIEKLIGLIKNEKIKNKKVVIETASL